MPSPLRWPPSSQRIERVSGRSQLPRHGRRILRGESSLSPQDAQRYAPSAVYACSLPSGRKQVAGAADRADHGRVRRIGLDLAADAGDAHVDGAVEGFAVARLRKVEQSFARQHSLGVFRKRLQQREFGADQRMLVALLVAQDLRVDVEPLGAEADRRAARCAGARPPTAADRRCGAAPSGCAPTIRAVRMAWPDNRRRRARARPRGRSGLRWR